MESTRIFISSSSQKELHALRQRTYEILGTIGHKPILWEKSFGPWPNTLDKSTVYKCLDEVAQSDIFILFVSDKAGTYLEWDDSSVTHLELRKAIELRKEIVVFVDTKVSSLYLGQLRTRIDDQLKIEAEHSKQDPGSVSVYGIVKNMDDLPDGIDTYTWVILHDCYQKNVFMEPMDLGVDIQTRIKQYLSDRLKRGAALLPAENQIKKNEVQAKEYADFLIFSKELLTMKQLGHWRRFLSRLLSSMQRAGDGKIVRKIGSYRQDHLVRFHACSGICLYKRSGGQLDRVEYAGFAEGKPCFLLDERDKFVVQAFFADDDINLFYKEEKQTLYLTMRTAEEYVFSFHFELEEKWSQQRVESCLAEMFNGILWEHSNRNFIAFAQLVLGGETKK